MSSLVLALALAAPMPAFVPAPPDVAAFLYPGRSPSVAARDGSGSGEWDGHGQPQIRLSLPYLQRRNEELSTADMMFQSLMQAVQAFYNTSSHSGATDKTVSSLRQQLARMGGASLDEAKASLQEAVELEQKRLAMVMKGAELAAENQQTIPGVDRNLVERRSRAIAAGKLTEVVDTRVRAHRSLAAGLVAYLDGDALGALEKMKAATRDGPELAMAHVYLGSLYYIFQQVDQALAEWRKALELDPANDTVRQAIKDHAAERK